MSAILQSGALTLSVSRGASSLTPSTAIQRSPARAPSPGKSDYCRREPATDGARRMRRRLPVTRWARPLAMVARTWGRRNGPEPRRSPDAWRRKSPALRGRPGGLIEAARRRRRAPRTRRTRTPVPHDRKPWRRSMTCERSRRTRHVSMNPLGFVTLRRRRKTIESTWIWAERRRAGGGDSPDRC